MVVAAVVVVAQGLSCAVAVACGVEELDEALVQVVSCVAAEVVDAVLEQTVEQRLVHGPCCLRVSAQNRRSF